MIQERRKELSRTKRERSNRCDPNLQTLERTTDQGKVGARGKKTGQADWKPKFNKPKIEDVKQRAESKTHSLSWISMFYCKVEESLQSKTQNHLKNLKSHRKKKQNLNPARRERSQSKRSRLRDFMTASNGCMDLNPILCP